MRNIFNTSLKGICNRMVVPTEMDSNASDTEAKAVFPPAPIGASEVLVPITSWPEMYRETAVTGVEFDLFWYDSVEEGGTYFFSWLGEPRCTVLVVWNDRGPVHIECRKANDVNASPAESLPVIAEVTHLFRSTGYGRGELSH